jgi:hypothetical protein
MWWLAWGGSDAPLTLLMRGPGTALLLATALAEAGFCTVNQARFEPGQDLRWTWRLLGAAAMCRFISIAINQWLPAIGLLEWVYRTPAAGTMAWCGHHLGGFVGFGLYLAALLNATLVYRRHGLLQPVPKMGVLLFLPVAGLTLHQTLLLLTSFRAELAHPERWWGWAFLPGLAGCVWYAQRLCISAACREGGLHGATWMSYVVAMHLTVVGTAGTWLFEMGILDWIVSSPLRWFAWYPAAAGFALAPVLHWEAGRLLRASGEPELRRLEARA